MQEFYESLNSLAPGELIFYEDRTKYLVFTWEMFRVFLTCEEDEEIDLTNACLQYIKNKSAIESLCDQLVGQCVTRRRISHVSCDFHMATYEKAVHSELNFRVEFD